MKYLALGCLFCIVFTQWGCASFTAMETGRTLGDGEFDVALSATSGQYAEVSIGGPNDDREEDDETSDDYPGNYLPIFEVGGTLGITDRTDLEVRFNSSFFISGRVKRQIIGTKTSRFAASTGLDGGTNLMTIPVGGVAYTHASIPVYLSFHPRETLAFYAVPRYTFVAITQMLPPPPDATETGSASWHFPGLSYGVSIGAERRLIVEFAHLGRSQHLPSQLSAGFVLPIGRVWK